MRGSLLVLFLDRRLVASLPENHYGERYLAQGLQYARGDGVEMPEKGKERKRRRRRRGKMVRFP